MTENQDYIYQSIVLQIRMGFFSMEEISESILEEVEDNGFEEEISEEWINSAIETEFQKLRTESDEWEISTATNRLRKAFDELCQLKIIALHHAGYTTSNGESEVVEVETQLREKGILSDGYCFYHGQDLARAIDPEQHTLFIAFQKINNKDDEVTIGVGKRVVQILEKHGFKVKWDGTANTKIEIPDFYWQKIYNERDEDLLDYSRLIDLMIK
ncbi:MAG: hypothetical protein H7282_12465 [Cytophagaceae bacterium]|nr:hypothetical protein [Cytophagaceae bacterium]